MSPQLKVFQHDSASPVERRPPPKASAYRCGKSADGSGLYEEGMVAMNFAERYGPSGIKLNVK